MIEVAATIAFVCALFVLYRILVQVKDAQIQKKCAVIEQLKEKISYLESKNKDLAETSPDVLLLRLKSRTQLLEDELTKAENEKGPLIEQVESLKDELLKLNNNDSSEKQQLINRLVEVSQHAAHIEAQRKQLQNQLREIEDPYVRFLEYANAEVSPARKEFLAVIINHLGIDYVISSTPNDLINSFEKVVNEIDRNRGIHPVIKVPVALLSALRSVGIVNRSEQLTLVGVSVFKTIARDMKDSL
ncbi:hypothetical protein E5115_004089 [Vibrio mimicus]